MQSFFSRFHIHFSKNNLKLKAQGSKLKAKTFFRLSALSF